MKKKIMVAPPIWILVSAVPDDRFLKWKIDLKIVIYSCWCLNSVTVPQTNGPHFGVLLDFYFITVDDSNFFCCLFFTFANKNFVKLNYYNYYSCISRVFESLKILFIGPWGLTGKGSHFVLKCDGCDANDLDNTNHHHEIVYFLLKIFFYITKNMQDKIF